MTIYLQRPFFAPTFKISSDDEALLGLLRLQYGPFACTFPATDVGLDPIEVIPQSVHSYIVQHRGGQVLTSDPLAELDNIFYTHTTYDPSILALHGSAVAWGGRAYVFLAITGSGKTTLASYLTSAGFDYITDDCILIDRDSLAVHPHCCPIHLRDGGLAVLERLGAAPQGLTYLNAGVMSRHIYMPGNCVTQPLPLGGVYFITLSNSTNEVLPLSANEALAQLMHAPMTPYAPTPDYLRLLMRLVQTGCQRLVYKDMDFVARYIKTNGG